jgi:hypothetical protein
MSIDKIKERIRMIENNDFVITGDTLNEAITGSEDDMRAIFAQRKGMLPKLRSMLGLRDRDSGSDNTLATLSKADKNTRDIQAAADRLFNTDGATRINMNNSENIPSKDHSKVHKIFDLMKKHNILPLNDLGQNNNPKYGYVRSNSQNGQNDVLVLLKTQSIQLQYDDDKLTKLISMVISNRNRRVNQNDFNAFYNEIDTNKTTYGVSNLVLKNTNIIINF